MKATKWMMKTVLLATLLPLATVWQAKATDEKYAALPLLGSAGQLAPGASCTVKDTAFGQPGQTTYALKNQVILRLDEFANITLPDTFKVTVAFDITYKYLGTGGTVQTSTVSQTLWVEYNRHRNYQSRAAYTFTGGFECTVAITGVTATSSTATFVDYRSALLLQNEIWVNREYTFDPFAHAVQSVTGSMGLANDPDGCSGAGEYKVSWGKVAVADEYDLEWTYIDSSALANYYLPNSTTVDPRKLFANNASRVSIKAENHTIPLLYDNGGILYYRVRSVQVKLGGQRMAANWSSEYGGGLGVYGFAGHERNLNWQASTAFAEEGKRKSVVQYFDGTLRNRQTVTKDNSTCNTVVAETLYDFQGRPVINVMPAPTISRLLSYTPNFSRAINQPGYEKTLYDADTNNGLNSCNDVLPGMDNSSGAAQYYSASNPLLAMANPGFHRFIPDAQHYPFAETRYTPDNTGRIAMQGGVGKTFQINQPDANGHSHETRYFYGGADQEELDGLFGTEVGNKTHYSKTMVRDANGQYSVSYTDMHGRTIATALAGLPTSGLDTLPSYRQQNITKKLIDPTNNLIDGTAIIASKSLLVTANGAHRFQYNLLPDSISVADCQNVNICYDCLYDLEITISNDCANPGTGPVVIRRTNLSPGALVDTLCNPRQQFPAVDTTVQLIEGSYTVTKKLSISPSGLAQYNEVFMRRNTCKTLQQFIDEQKQLFLASIDCYPTCQSCTDSLGTWAQYRERFMQQQGIPTADTASFREQAWMAYEAQREACEDLCENTGLHNSIRQQMMADMTVPFGQYAMLDSASDFHSIFYTLNGASGLRFKQVSMPFLNEAGMPDSIINAAGIKVPPTDPSVTAVEFADNFKESWAKTLLPLHPEYCKLEKYESYTASHLWDERFGKVETFRQAVDSGFLNPANLSGLPSTTIFAHQSAHADPFFASLEPGQKNNLSNALFAFVANPAINAWSMATIMAHCGEDANCANGYIPLNMAFVLDTACRGELDMAWRYFREMYLNKKAQIVDDIVKAACPNNNILPWHYLSFPHIVPAAGVEGLTANATAGADSLNALIADNCKAYVGQWWQEMRPCGFTSADSAIVVPRLLQVCRDGGDATHLFGSSTVRPGMNPAPAYTSFEDVIRQYRISTGKPYDTTCNAYLITVPRPYDKQPAYGNVDVWTKPDSCQCSKITGLYQQYLQTPGATSFVSYVQQKTGILMRVGQLDTLRKLCNGEINCQFLASPISLPPAFQCNTVGNCATCAEVGVAFNGFKTAFPGVLPAYNEADSMQQKRNRLFENYMNYRLGLAKTAVDYLRFMDTCGIGYISTAQQQACTELTALLYDYQQHHFTPYTPQPGPGGCDTGLVKINSARGINVHGTTMSTAQWMYNGVLKTPFGDSTTFTPTITFKDSVCIDSSFAVEARMRFPVQARGLGWFNNTPGSPGGQYGSYGSTLNHYRFDGDRYVSVWLANGTNWRNTFPGDSIYLYVQAYLNGTVYYISGPISTGLKYLGDWATLKLQVVGGEVRVLLNGVQKASYTYSTPLNQLLLMDHQPIGFNFQLDWWKLYDKKERLRYFEDFNGCDKMGGQTLPACGSNCAADFVNHFNARRGTAYGAAQVDSLYQATCGKKPEPCYKDPIGCNELKQALVDWYVSTYNIHYDSNGVEKNVITLNSNYVWRSLAGYNLKDFVRDGILGTPDSVTVWPGDFGYNFPVMHCPGNSFSFETRIRVKPGHDASLAQVNPILWFGNHAALRPLFTGNSGYNGLYGNYVSAAGASIPFESWIAGPPNNPLFTNWRTIKVTLERDTAYLYLDGALWHKVYFPGTFNKFNFSIAGWYTIPLQVDYVKLYDRQGNLRYNEEFTDYTRFSKPAYEWICPDINCNSSFTSFYNNRFGTDLGHNQLALVYGQRCGLYTQPCVGGPGPLLCSGGSAFPPVAPPDLGPCADSTLFSLGSGTLLYNAYQDSLRNAFNNRYMQKCLGAAKTESFTVTAPVSEYHYTLYYYDQAGSLVKTVPPAGVDAGGMWRQGYLDSVATARQNGTEKLPAHTLATQYRYNTLGQVTAQQSPDGGLSRFWYDRLGRLVLSQNAWQRSASATENGRLYSYTKYDWLGRIAEVGQIKNNEVSEPVDQLLTRDNTALQGWLHDRANLRGQITQTYYDVKYPGFAGQEGATIGQRNLRNRVSYTSLTDTATLAGYQHATFYSYDMHGNVDTLLQDYGSSSFVANIMNVQGNNANRWKRLVYGYDLISGKVNTVAYQPARGTTRYPDAFYHRYGYDAENRLVLAETSTDSVFWERDGRYEYYRHGPLARMVLGEQMVQGLDYGYTLQGWLKGVNSHSRTLALYDMGWDGRQGTANDRVARDAFGYSLNYYNGDYQLVGGSGLVGSGPWMGGNMHNLTDAEGKTTAAPLYNGNIASMAVSLPAVGTSQLYAYRYDQLNRITRMDAFGGMGDDANAFWPQAGQQYKERVSYDANGNILRYLRHGSAAQNLHMDSLTYKYKTGTNQLRQVRDAVSELNYKEDIDDQPDVDNYVYDAIGNLIADKKDSISLIRWNVYGKIAEIQRVASAARPVANIKYYYDAGGNRIGKRVEKMAGTVEAHPVEYIWYVRDASGNVMAVYNGSGTGTVNGGHGLQLTEQHLYGSSRLGLLNRTVDMKPLYNSPAIVTFMRGNKFFELSNHLGNVLATVSDRKLQAGGGTVGQWQGYYEAEVITANDYYPFGSIMPGRKYSAGIKYRYGFNGKENDNEVKGDGNQQDYGLRIYDPRLGRLYSIDPLSPKYPQLTPYQFASNRPIDGVDQLGLQWSKDELLAMYNNATAMLNNMASKSIITLRGTSNALVNANTFGASDLAQHLPKWWGVGTTANLRDYSDVDDQKAYLLGRLLGDASALLQSLAEVSGGMGGAAGGLATGPGALVVSSTGLIVAGHGAAVGAAAASDLGWTLGKLLSLGVSVKATTDASTNQQASSANSGTSSSGSTKTRYDGPKPKYKVGEHYKNTTSKGGNKTKTALPKDAEQTYKNAIPDDPVKPNNWYGINSEGNVYRYSSKNSSEAHFSGQSNVGNGIRNYTQYAKDRLKELNPNVKF